MPSLSKKLAFTLLLALSAVPAFTQMPNPYGTPISLENAKKAAAPALAKPTTRTIDPSHSSAGFIVRHKMDSNVKGGFGKVAGNIEFDAVRRAQPGGVEVGDPPQPKGD